MLIIGAIIAKPFHMKKGCQELSFPFSCIINVGGLACMVREDNTLYLRLDHNVNLYKWKRIGDQ